MSVEGWRQRVDWSLSNPEIAERYRLRADSVSRFRRIDAPETVRPTNNIPLDTVDWDLTNQELASIHGKHPNSWGRLRRKHAPETVRPVGRPVETRSIRD